MFYMVDMASTDLVNGSDQHCVSTGYNLLHIRLEPPQLSVIVDHLYATPKQNKN